MNTPTSTVVAELTRTAAGGKENVWTCALCGVATPFLSAMMVHLFVGHQILSIGQEGPKLLTKGEA